jgi:hypothetical protein
MMFGGKFILGAPIEMGILDLGNIGPETYNHTGAIGFAFWEENWPQLLTPRDPALSVLDFLRCGSVFYPIPMVPVPIPKAFQLWPLPPFFPLGQVNKFSFFYSDRGGCFFMNGAPTQFADGGPKSIMLLPTPSIKFVAPSWLFILSDIKVNGKSIKPCLIPPLCRAVVRTGQFSITGPMFPMLALLEEVAAPSTCENIENLPDITFVIMGQPFTMTKDDYVIFGQNYDEVACMTAFTPEAQLIPGFELWVFGDAFVRAFYSTFTDLPMRKLAVSKTDHRYYEKNGCEGGAGEGPLTRWKPTSKANPDAGADKQIQDQKDDKKTQAMAAKRRENWEADLKGAQATADDNAKNEALGAPFGMCGPATGSQRFRMQDGKCEPIPEDHDAHDEEEDDEFRRAGRAVNNVGAGGTGVRVSDVAPTRGGVIQSATQKFGLDELLLEVDATTSSSLRSMHASLEAELGPEIAASVIRDHTNFRRSAEADRNARGTNARHEITRTLAHDDAMTAFMEVQARNLSYEKYAHTHAHTVPRAQPAVYNSKHWNGHKMHIDEYREHRHSEDPWVAYVAAGAITVLPELSAAVDYNDKEHEASYLRNMSIVLAHMARAMNVTDLHTSRYWRGESEEWQHNQYLRMLDNYRKEIKAARKQAQEHYSTTTTILSLLRQSIADMTKSLDDRDKMLDIALARMGLMESSGGPLVLDEEDDQMAEMLKESSNFPYFDREDIPNFAQSYSDSLADFSIPPDLASSSNMHDGHDRAGLEDAEEEIEGKAVLARGPGGTWQLKEASKTGHKKTSNHDFESHAHAMLDTLSDAIDKHRELMNDHLRIAQEHMQSLSEPPSASTKTATAADLSKNALQESALLLEQHAALTKQIVAKLRSAYRRAKTTPPQT